MTTETETKIDPTAACPCYVAIKPCGCCVCAAVDDPEHDKARKRETAKDVAKWLRAGLTIERKTVGWVRENFKLCKCE